METFLPTLLVKICSSIRSTPEFPKQITLMRVLSFVISDNFLIHMSDTLYKVACVNPTPPSGVQGGSNAIKLL